MPIVNHEEARGYRSLGIYLQRLRQERRLGLREAARTAGVDPTWLLRLEKGVYVTPNTRGIAKVAKGYGVDVEELYIVAGLSDGRGLPGFAPYLRAKYALPDDAISQLESHFALLNDKYQGGVDHDDDNKQSA